MSQDEIVIYKAIDEILWKEWDPIGINDFAENARDEYYSYIPQVFSLKIDSSCKEKIAEYLHKIETVQMGLVGNLTRCEEVAKMICEI